MLKVQWIFKTWRPTLGTLQPSSNSFENMEMIFDFWFYKSIDCWWYWVQDWGRIIIWACWDAGRSWSRQVRHEHQQHLFCSSRTSSTWHTNTWSTWYFAGSTFGSGYFKCGEMHDVKALASSCSTTNSFYYLLLRTSFLTTALSDRKSWRKC